MIALCLSIILKTIQPWVTSWSNRGPLNFVLLKKGANINGFNRKIAGIITANGGDTSRRAAATQFSGMYLHNNAGNPGSTERVAYVQTFSLIALFILVIACINFMNLSTAKASRRMKEVGIKKVVGADRTQLVVQFLSESILISMLAGILAVVIALLLLPAFNQLTGKQIILQPDTKTILAILGVVLATGLLSGSYPAFYLSKFNPLAVLKGKLSTSFAELLSRKGLVVFQFTLSTILIVAVLIIYRQVAFIQSANPGYNKDNVVRIDAEGTIAGHEQQFASELKNIAGVTDASYTFTNMVGHTYGDYGLSWPGKDPNAAVYFEVFGGGYDFVKTMGMQLLNGRGFSRDFGTDTAAIIINEAAARVMAIRDPVGKTIQQYQKNVAVIGMVKDFHFESLHTEVKPAIVLLQPNGAKIMVRLNASHQQATLAAIRKLYESYNPGFAFSYHFLDEAYQKQYDAETRVAALSKYFAGLAVMISCLGLFGLAAFTAQKRGKEIGIRKIVGASTISITTMLSADFLKLIGVSLLIAFPVAGWLMAQWLQSFAYRIQLTPSVFILAGLSVIVVTLLTISFQSVKAALANPVTSLRSE